MTDLTQLIGKWREMADKATPGPWKSEYWFNGGGCPIGGFAIPGLNDPSLANVDKSKGMVEMLADDAALIALSRTLLPALLDVADAAEKAQSAYMKHAGDWYDAELDEALARLAEVGKT